MVRLPEAEKKYFMWDSVAEKLIFLKTPKEDCQSGHFFRLISKKNNLISRMFHLWDML
jgi:hypothetical protein